MDKIFQPRRDIFISEIAEILYLSSNIRSDVTRPVFSAVEGNDTKRVAVLAFDQIIDHRFEIGVTYLGLPPHAAGVAAVDYQIYGVVHANRYYGWSPIRTHDTQLRY
jgi:hypothetical protein